MDETCFTGLQARLDQFSRKVATALVASSSAVLAGSDHPPSAADLPADTNSSGDSKSGAAELCFHNGSRTTLK